MGLEIHAFRKQMREGKKMGWRQVVYAGCICTCSFTDLMAAHRALQSEKQLPVIDFMSQYQGGRIWPVLACVP